MTRPRQPNSAIANRRDPASPENFGGRGKWGIERGQRGHVHDGADRLARLCDSEKGDEEDPIAWPGRLHLASLKMEDGESLFGGFTEEEFRARELRCMTAAIYFEARSESRRGRSPWRRWS